MVRRQFPGDPLQKVGVHRPGEDPRLVPVDQIGRPGGKHPLQKPAELGPADSRPHDEATLRDPADPGPRHDDGHPRGLIAAGQSIRNSSRTASADRLCFAGRGSTIVPPPIVVTGEELRMTNRSPATAARGAARTIWQYPSPPGSSSSRSRRMIRAMTSLVPVWNRTMVRFFKFRPAPARWR